MRWVFRVRKHPKHPRMARRLLEPMVHKCGTKNGKLHREGFSHAMGFPCTKTPQTPQDGPAIIYADGSQSWWINGKKVEPFKN